MESKQARDVFDHHEKLTAMLDVYVGFVLKAIGTE